MAHVRSEDSDQLGHIHPVWSESSLCTLWVVKNHSFLKADSKDCDLIGRMPRVILVFAGYICLIVCFVMIWVMPAKFMV